MAGLFYCKQASSAGRKKIEHDIKRVKQFVVTGRQICTGIDFAVVLILDTEQSRPMQRPAKTVDTGSRLVVGTESPEWCGLCDDATGDAPERSDVLEVFDAPLVNIVLRAQHACAVYWAQITVLQGGAVCSFLDRAI